VRIAEKQIDAIELDAIHLGGGRQSSASYRGRSELGARAAYPPGPATWLVQSRIVVGHILGENIMI